MDHTSENQSKKHSCVGILAHVDAGKTTLSEALLCEAGVLRRLGRVDHGDTLMDTHPLERQRGITIFAGQAVFSAGDWEITLLDTPGHVDFSAETERILPIMDYAILVISGTDGVQAHTRTLWRLLSLYQVPAFIFVTKMDFVRRTKKELMQELQKELSTGCVDFSEEDETVWQENLAICREDLLNQYIDGKPIEEESIAELIHSRQIFPCYFGSGLKRKGIEEFLQGLVRYMQPSAYPEIFGARVFKISYDSQGNRLTHLKVTGGVLGVRDKICYQDKEEKISQIRIYTGSRFSTAEKVRAGGICAVQGLTATRAGQGLGQEAEGEDPMIEPVMEYRILLPEDCDPKSFLPKLRLLEEEDPQLRLTWDGDLQEIHVGLMGEVQTEVLKSLILNRFGAEVKFDSGRVLYKETIAAPVEGVGHFEPLRHYAEVHLLMEPLPRGSGLIFAAQCSEEMLERNWQRLILTHLKEKQHVGVLTGSPVTDMKITLTAGRAHLKHTEGGDFRQATYRAVRQGLMQAECILLEPYYAFKLEVPSGQLSRAMHDIRMRWGTVETTEEVEGRSFLRGTVPVTAFKGYVVEVASYTGGQGRLSCEIAGYGLCHNSQEVIAALDYQPERDLENPPDSVFCAHGGGFTVKWDKVPEYMHLESCMKKKEREISEEDNHRNRRIDDQELNEIMEREFGPIKRPSYRPARIYRGEEEQEPVKLLLRPRYIIVDGYNVIFAWEELKELAGKDLGAARIQLLDILSSYQAFTGCEVVVVFDGYKVPGNQGEHLNYHDIQVVYTKEQETGDLYIEKLAGKIGKNQQARVVTSDGMIQLSALRSGVMPMSAREFWTEIVDARQEMRTMLNQMNQKNKLRKNEIFDQLTEL